MKYAIRRLAAGAFPASFAPDAPMITVPERWELSARDRFGAKWDLGEFATREAAVARAPTGAVQ